MTAQLAFKSYTTEYWYKWMEYCKGVLGRYRNGPLTCTLVSQDQYSCFTRHLLQIFLLKVAFIQKVRFVFQISKTPKKNIPNYYPELEIWICCLLLLAGNLNFKLRIAFRNIVFWRFGDLKNASHFLKKSHL